MVATSSKGSVADVVQNVRICLLLLNPVLISLCVAARPI